MLNYISSLTYRSLRASFWAPNWALNWAFFRTFDSSKWCYRSLFLRWAFLSYWRTFLSSFSFFLLVLVFLKHYKLIMQLWYYGFHNLEFFWCHRLLLLLCSIILLVNHLNNIIKASRRFDLLVVLTFIIVLEHVWQLVLGLLAKTITRHDWTHSVLVHLNLILWYHAASIMWLTIWNADIG